MFHCLFSEPPYGCGVLPLQKEGKAAPPPRSLTCSLPAFGQAFNLPHDTVPAQLDIDWCPLPPHLFTSLDNSKITTPFDQVLRLFAHHFTSSRSPCGEFTESCCRPYLYSNLPIGSGIFGYINYLVEKDRKYILDTLVNGWSKGPPLTTSN